MTKIEATEVKPEEAKIDKVDTAEPDKTEETPKAEPEKPYTPQLYKTQATGIMDPIEYQQLKVLATDLIKSKAIPRSFENADQLLIGMLTGIEMGMKPMQAIQSLYIVNGAINIWGKALVRRLTEHGYTIRYKNESDESCTAIVGSIANGMIIEETYTYAEAEASGYVKDSGGKPKIGWRAGINRRLKLRYGVLSLIVKTYMPEVMGSVAGVVEVEEDFNPAKETNRERILEALDKKREEGEDIVEVITPKPIKK